LLVLVSLPAGAREKSSNHWAVVFASNCLRMDRGKVCMPYSFLLSEPVWRAEWKTLRLALQIKIDRQRQELGVMAPIRYGLTSPFRADHGQNAMVRLVLTATSLLADFHVTIASLVVNEGRIQGRGRKPSRPSYGVLRRRTGSHGAWPWEGTPPRISDP